MQNKKNGLNGTLLRIAAAAAALSFTSSCFMMTALPPGFTKNGGTVRAAFPQSASNEAAYAVLTWYTSQHPEEMRGDINSAVKAATEDISLSLFKKWCAKAVEKGAPLLRIENGRPVLSPAVFSQNISTQQGLSILRELTTLMDAPMEITVQPEAALSPELWRKSSNSMRKDFAEWIQDKRKLPFNPPPSFNPEEFRTELHSLIQLLISKQKILDCILEYKNITEQNEDNLRHALKTFSALRNELPENLSFNSIGDTATLRMFNETWEKLPDECLATILRPLENAAETETSRLSTTGITSDSATAQILNYIEKTLSAKLAELDNNPDFSKALNKYRDRIHALTAKSAAMRTAFQANSLKTLAQNKDYWDASISFRSCWNELDNSKDLCLYKMQDSSLKNTTFADTIKSSIAKVYIAILPEAMNFLLDEASTATEISNKHGYAAAICSMILRMSSLPKNIQADTAIQECRTKTELLKAKTEKLLEETSLRRSVSIGDMSSATPGIGLTYSKDLEHELKNILSTFGLSKYVGFQEYTTSASQWGYVTYGGMVANFDAGETIERKTARTLKIISEGIRQHNPDYKPDAPPSAPKSSTSKVMYTQKESLQVIHVKEVERLAHIRVFMNFRGPGFTDLVEINEFYSKIFSIEESHPFNDVKQTETRYCYDAMELQKATSEPELRYDRIWSAGEMLDWARQDSLKLAALILLRYINAYPLDLAAKAENLTDTNHAEAAELWSQCRLLCQSLDTDAYISSLLKTPAPAAAKAYPECIEKLRLQWENIGRIKRTATDNMLEQVNLALKDKIRNLNQPDK